MTLVSRNGTEHAARAHHVIHGCKELPARPDKPTSRGHAAFPRSQVDCSVAEYIMAERAVAEYIMAERALAAEVPADANARMSSLSGCRRKTFGFGSAREPVGHLLLG